LEQLALITAENVVYADESGMDNRDEYAYGWNKSGSSGSMHSSQENDSGVGSDGFPVLDPNPSKDELI